MAGAGEGAGHRLRRRRRTPMRGMYQAPVVRPRVRDSNSDFSSLPSTFTVSTRPSSVPVAFMLRYIGGMYAQSSHTMCRRWTGLQTDIASQLSTS